MYINSWKNILRLQPGIRFYLFFSLICESLLCIALSCLHVRNASYLTFGRVILISLYKYVQIQFLTSSAVSPAEISLRNKRAYQRVLFVPAYVAINLSQAGKGNLCEMI